jgi:lipopolysaccharide transport system ATP-binding protein
VITVNSVKKTFKLYSSPAHRLKEIIFRGKHHKTFQALNGVSFHVAAGETLGVLGSNGAGKSTLLKIITGILLPDQGTVTVNGRVTGLLELGTGFNPDLTGRQNISMNGLLLGMDSAEIQAKEQRIINFAEIGIFIDEPLSTYSSGMSMRLAFAIAINADPNCFIIDEALSVGDAGFQQKCMRRIKEFKQQGGAIIFVSHDMNAVKQLCDSAILLNKGEVMAQGAPDEIVNQYNRLLSTQNNHQITDLINEDGSQSYGSLEAKIKKISINGSAHKAIVISGEKITITVEIDAYKSLSKLRTGIIIRDKFGQDIYGTNTYAHDHKFSIKSEKTYHISYQLDINIGAGKYTVGAAIQSIPTEAPHRINWTDSLMEFEVLATTEQAFIGLCKLQPDITIQET